MVCNGKRQEVLRLQQIDHNGPYKIKFNKKLSGGLFKTNTQTNKSQPFSIPLTYEK